MVRYRTDSVFPTDTGNGTLAKRLAKNQTVDTITGLLENTTYRFGLFVRDSAKLWSSAIAAAQVAQQTSDLTAPLNVTVFTVTFAAKDSAQISWVPSISTDVDSVVIRFKTGAYPSSYTDGTLWRRYGKTATNDIVYGLSQNTVWYFGAFVKDVAGNWCDAVTVAQDTVKIPDQIGPDSISISIVDNAGYTATIRPRLILFAAGADSMRSALSPDTSVAWKRYGTIDSLNLGREGLQRVYAQFKDNAGNKSAWVSDSTMYDITAPVPVSFVIADNRGYTSDHDPALAITATGADSMRIALAQDTSRAAWKPSGRLDSISIADGSDGRKSVWVQFKDFAGNFSGWVMDSTVFDTTAPTVVIGTAAGLYGRASWPQTITGSAGDNLAGIAAVNLTIQNQATAQYWSDKGFSSAPAAVSATVGVGFTYGFTPTLDGTYFISAVAVDNAGNQAPSAVTALVFDGTAPTGVFTIVDQNGYTRTTAISANCSAESADSMRIVQWPDTGSAFTFKAYATGSPLVLSSKEGLVNLAVQYKDLAGNRSAFILDSTTYDVTPPSAVTAFAAMAQSASSARFVWQPSASADAESLRICISQSAVPQTPVAGDWTRSLAVGTFTDTLVGLPATGIKLYVSGFVCDKAGNWSVYDPLMSATVNLPDGVAPQNNVDVTLRSVGDSAIAVAWTVDPAISTEVKDLFFGLTYGARTQDTARSMRFNYRDTAFVVYPAVRQGTWQSALLLTDSSGNLSKAVVDSTVIKNTAPVLRVAADTTIRDGLAWSMQTIMRDINGDALRLGLALAPAGMVIDSLSGLIAWLPLRADLGVHTVVVRCADALGASVTDTIALTVIHINEPPDTKIGRKLCVGGAAQYTVNATDESDSGITYRASLKCIDDTSRIFIRDRVLSPISFYPLADGRYLLAVSARDRQGMVDSTPAIDTLLIAGFTRKVIRDTVWGMFGLPAQTVAAAALTVKGNLSHWDENLPERTLYSYYQKGTEITDLTAGRAYWHRSPDSVIINVTQKDLVDSSFRISLTKGKYGWNQIASPYPYPVSFKGGALWRWDALTGDYVNDQAVLMPWQGYWVQADSTYMLTLDNTPLFGQTMSLAKRASKSWFVDQTEWQVQIGLSSSANQDADNRIGFSKQASNNYDALDLAEPPRMDGQSYLFFPHGDWKRSVVEYAADIRNFNSGVTAFEVGIASGAPGSLCTLTVSGLEKLSGVYLFYADGQSVVPCSPDAVLVVPSAAKTQYRTFFASSSKTWNVPMQFALNHPYPNPVRPMARISYMLPYSWGQDGALESSSYVVRMQIYDIMGRIVRDLVHRQQTPGQYSVIWDGKSNNGQRVASGHYFCSLSAGKYKGLQTMIVMP